MANSVLAHKCVTTGAHDLVGVPSLFEPCHPIYRGNVFGIGSIVEPAQRSQALALESADLA
jgi:hypothetical protein